MTCSWGEPGAQGHGAGGHDDGRRDPSYGALRRRTISAIQTGAYGEVQFGGVG